MRNTESIPMTCGNWLALGACIYSHWNTDKVLKLLGLAKAPKRKLDWKAIIQEAQALQNEGYSIYAIANELNISLGLLYAKLHEENDDAKEM